MAKVRVRERVKREVAYRV